MIEIKEVKTKSDIKLFAKYPLELYKDCPYYVPNLRSDEIDTFDPNKNFNLKQNKIKGFLCYKDGKLVGRIAGLINFKENEIYGEDFIRFSRFECIDDIEVFKALLKAVAKFGKDNGVKVLHGPWGFNDTDREGMLTEGFDRRSTYASNYYYPYFHENIEKLGFADESKWVEWQFTIPSAPIERIDKLAERVRTKLGFVDVTETMSLKEIIKVYGKQVFETMNDAYGHLDGYVPIEGKAVDNVLKQFATIINPRYLSVVVDKNNNVAAFGVVLPSICDAVIKSKGKLFPTGFIGVLRSIKSPKELEMGMIGVRKEYKNTGINAMLISRILRNVIEDGVERIESNLMLEHNLNIQQQWKFTESELIKKRQTYRMDIDKVLEL
jgi:GNAT superfamily N-acetyltransferase